MTQERIEQLEAEPADLRARWPRHSVKPAMWRRLEELEEALERAQREETDHEGGA